MGEVNVQQAEKKAQFMTKFVPRPGSMTREVRSLQFSFFWTFYRTSCVTNDIYQYRQ